MIRTVKVMAGSTKDQFMIQVEAENAILIDKRFLDWMYELDQQKIGPFKKQIYILSTRLPEGKKMTREYDHNFTHVDLIFLRSIANYGNESFSERLKSGLKYTDPEWDLFLKECFLNKWKGFLVKVNSLVE